MSSGSLGISLSGMRERLATSTSSRDVPRARGTNYFRRRSLPRFRAGSRTRRSDAELGLELCIEDDDLLDANGHRWVLGFLDLSLSDHVAAIRSLEPVIEYLDAFGAAEPGSSPASRMRSRH